MADNVLPSSPPPLCSEPTLPSSPPPALKQKKPPPVTPRSFRRFFTPRSSLNDSKSTSNGRFRFVLSDITIPALNRFGPAFPRTPSSSDHEDSKESLVSVQTPNKKRKLSFGSSSPPLQSSPLRRVRLGPTIYVDPEDEEDEEPKAASEYTKEEPKDEPAPPVPLTLRRSKALQSANPAFLRNLTGRTAKLTLRASYTGSWRDETANFYSRPEDVHPCVQDDHLALPFCTASCNSMSNLPPPWVSGSLIES